MLFLAIIVAILSATSVPVWIGRHVRRDMSTGWASAFVLTGLVTNGLLFPLTFLIAGQIGAGIGEELSQSIGSPPMLTRLLGLLVSIASACAFISMIASLLIEAVRRTVAWRVEARHRP